MRRGGASDKWKENANIFDKVLCSSWPASDWRKAFLPRVPDWVMGSVSQNSLAPGPAIAPLPLPLKKDSRLSKKKSSLVVMLIWVCHDSEIGPVWSWLSFKPRFCIQNFGTNGYFWATRVVLVSLELCSFSEAAIWNLFIPSQGRTANYMASSQCPPVLVTENIKQDSASSKLFFYM